MMRLGLGDLIAGGKAGGIFSKQGGLGGYALFLPSYGQSGNCHRATGCDFLIC